MPVVAIVCGALLIALSAYSYTASDSKSPTAFIPGGMGVVLAVCGLLARRPSLEKHAMHLAALVGLLGLVAGGVQLGLSVSKFGFDLQHPEAGLKQQAFLVLSVVCGVFVAMCVNTFIQGRRRRDGVV